MRPHRRREEGDVTPRRGVLAAVDFSEGSRVALAFAARLATQMHAQLHVLHAVDPVLAALGGDDGQRFRSDVRQELQRHLSSITTTPVDASCCHVVDGLASTVIVNIAMRERANVVVLGTRGLSNLEWPALGSTLEDVLRRTSTSLIAVPPTWTPPQMGGADLSGTGPIIAGVNITCPALSGAVEACRLAASLETEAILLHVVPPPQTAPRWQALASAAADAQLDIARQDIEGATSLIRAQSPVRTTLVVEQGDVARVIARAASQHADGIVVLGRGNAPYPYGPPGSIVARTLILGGLPVLMHLVS
jgi:nucleotide-binding universal stress UspA family protein